jgi:ankyrin repeat domain-containing protein 50
MEIQCWQALHTSNYEDYKGRHPDRVKGTCEWFLKHKRFINWQKSTISSLLWLSAGPGCGNSIFSKSLLDNEFRIIVYIMVCYFSFKDDTMDQKSATKTLFALLHQPFDQKKSLIKYAMSDLKKNGSTLSENFSKLWSILTSAASDPQAGHIVCVLDALDECRSVNQVRIINELVQFYSNAVNSAQNKSMLKFAVTSRPLYDIEAEYRQLTGKIPPIRLSGDEESEKITLEIDLVIKARVSALGPKLGHSRQELLRKKLLEIPHRTYLWLKLIFELISDCSYLTKATINEAISTIPENVGEAYEAILSRIKKRDIPRARKLLCIVLAAVRPLTSQEMNIPLAIQNGTSSLTELDLQSEESLESTV